MNAVLDVVELSVNDIISAERISPIEGQIAEISIPIREVLAGVGNKEEARMATILFRNMSGLLPESLVDANDKN